MAKNKRHITHQKQENLTKETLLQEEKRKAKQMPGREIDSSGESMAKSSCTGRLVGVGMEMEGEHKAGEGIEEREKGRARELNGWEDEVDRCIG